MEHVDAAPHHLGIIPTAHPTGLGGEGPVKSLLAEPEQDSPLPLNLAYCVVVKRGLVAGRA